MHKKFSNVMRTTLDLPEELIKETMHLTGAKTKTEAIKVAMKEHINYVKRMKLLELEGSMPDLKIDLDVSRDRKWLKDLNKWTS